MLHSFVDALSCIFSWAKWFLLLLMSLSIAVDGEEGYLMSWGGGVSDVIGEEVSDVMGEEVSDVSNCSRICKFVMSDCCL